jgi:hemolysin III
MATAELMGSVYWRILEKLERREFNVFDSATTKLSKSQKLLLIAGTYTPFCLTVLNGWIGWTLFGVVWGCAVAGIILKVFSTGRYEVLSTSLYVAMGWLALLFIKPLYSAISIEGFILLMTGGAFYSFGVFFFAKDRVTYFHGIWHMFVLAGSAFHFFSVLTLL